MITYKRRALFVLLTLCMSGCVLLSKENQQAPTVGAQLIALKEAYEAEAIDAEEYNKLRATFLRDQAEAVVDLKDS